MPDLHLGNRRSSPVTGYSDDRRSQSGRYSKGNCWCRVPGSMVQIVIEFSYPTLNFLSVPKSNIVGHPWTPGRTCPLMYSDSPRYLGVIVVFGKHLTTALLYFTAKQSDISLAIVATVGDPRLTSPDFTPLTGTSAVSVPYLVPPSRLGVRPPLFGEHLPDESQLAARRRRLRPIFHRRRAPPVRSRRMHHY